MMLRIGLVGLLRERKRDVVVVSPESLPCLQVCFYCCCGRVGEIEGDSGDINGGKNEKGTGSGTDRRRIRMTERMDEGKGAEQDGEIQGRLSNDSAENSRIMEEVVPEPLPRGWIVDYAQNERCAFLRVVIGWETRFETVEALARDVVAVSREIIGSDDSE